MKKKKVILLVAAGVAVVLLLVAGFLLYRGVVSLNKVKSDLKSAEDSLDRLYKKNPFPSEDNVKVERDNTSLLTTWKAKLLNELRKGQIVPDRDKSPSAFISILTEKVKELTDQAAQLHPETVGENFAFGFGRYFTADGARPDPMHVPRLTQQLLIVEGLTKVLLEEEVGRIALIEREEFEVEKRGAPNLSEVGIIGETNLFAKLHFTFEVATDEEALLGILNRFAKYDQFVVVTSVNMSKSVPDVKDATRAVDEREEDEDEDVDFDAPQTPTPTGVESNAMTREERVVSGSELERPMMVRLDVDVYWFGAAKAGPPEEEKAEEE